MNTHSFEQERAYLKQLAYSIIGTSGDAEDIVQDAFLRWRRADQSVVREPRAFLTRIVTRLAIDHLKSARSRRETYVGAWLPEPLVQDVFVDPTQSMQADTAVEQADEVSHALMIVLERLSPAERAAFLLRKIFDYDYDEIASTLGKSKAACRQLAKRATDRVQEEKARFEADQQTHGALVAHFAMATMSGDLAGLQSILAQDVSFQSDHGGKVTAARNVLINPDRVGRFFIGVQKKFGAKSQGFLARVNGELGLVVYNDGVLTNIITFEVVDAKIQKIFSMRNPDKLQTSSFYRLQ